MRESLSLGYKEISEKTQRIAELEAQTAKAKEIIKKMSYEYQRLCLIKKETLTEAEQFIKDSEVEK